MLRKKDIEAMKKLATVRRLYNWQASLSRMEFPCPSIIFYKLFYPSLSFGKTGEGGFL
jgi:hypothetical protein